MNNAELIERLRREVAEAPEPGLIDVVWAKHYAKLERTMLNEDPGNFLQWDTIIRTMHVGAGMATKRQYGELRRRADRDEWFGIAKEVPIGNPKLLPWDKNVSGQSVAHALHLAKFQDATGLRITDMKHIFEFGGGYGSMRRIVDRLGFEGDYVIYDLPVMSALQRFYLGTLGIEAKCVDRVEDVREEIPHFNHKLSLFIATASLSEAPLELREMIKSLIWGCHGILILFKHRFSEFDNVAYFNGWKNTLCVISEEYRWTMSLDKSRGDRSYLFGVIQ